MRFPLILSLLILLLSACGESPPDAEETPRDGILQELKSASSITTDVNARAPAFARKDTSGQTLKTQDYIGRGVLLLDFWSVFCQSCLEEIPFLKELYGRYHDQGLEVISINTDFFPRARIEKFMDKTGLELPFPLILDRDQSLSDLFQVEALPVNVLIDSSGWIRMVHLGYRPGDRSTIESRVKKACRKIKETVVTLQPVEGRTAFAPPDRMHGILPPGTLAPAFEADDGKGLPVSFSTFRGESPALVFFWSIFCKPCRDEFSHLISLDRKYSPRGLKTLAVNIDSAQLIKAAQRLLSKKGGGIPGVFDNGEAEHGNTIAGLYGVRYTPSTFLIDTDGVVQSSFSGEVPLAQLEEGILRLFSDKSQASGAGSGSAEDPAAQRSVREAR